VSAAELASLLDERAVLRVLAEYAHALDVHDVDSWVDTFTPDGIFDVVEAGGRRLHREVGHAELTRWAQGAPPGRQRHHVLADPLVTLDGDQARVESCWVLLERDEHAHPVVGAFGRYSDRLVKRDGRWRIAERRAEVEASTRRPVTAGGATA
jgi:3-phenylpropionate/cinnamic acid dioxygenase small subunit